MGTGSWRAMNRFGDWIFRVSFPVLRKLMPTEAARQEVILEFGPGGARTWQKCWCIGYSPTNNQARKRRPVLTRDPLEHLQ